jgi:hypothetical protein
MSLAGGEVGKRHFVRPAYLGFQMVHFPGEPVRRQPLRLGIRIQECAGTGVPVLSERRGEGGRYSWTSLTLLSSERFISAQASPHHRQFSKDAGLILECLARIIHECRHEAFETDARRGFSHVRPTQAYRQSVEKPEQEQPSRAKGSDAVAGIRE